MKQVLMVSLAFASVFTGCYTIVARDVVIYQEVYPLPPHPRPFPPPPPPPPPQPIIEYTPTVHIPAAPPPSDHTIRDSGTIRTDRHARDEKESRKRDNTERGNRGR